jgi:hypothetical protein
LSNISCIGITIIFFKDGTHFLVNFIFHGLSHPDNIIGSQLLYNQTIDPFKAYCLYVEGDCIRVCCLIDISINYIIAVNFINIINVLYVKDNRFKSFAR